MWRMKLSKLKPKSNKILHFKEGGYYTTVGGWTARVIYVKPALNICFAVHNPSTEMEAGPIPHELTTGVALSFTNLPFMTPPAYLGHPADLIAEVVPN